MEEKKFVNVRKEEHAIKAFVKKEFGKGKISTVKIEYTPVGEKIIVSTHKPGLVIGKRGEKIAELTEILKKRFKMENPHIDISEIKNPYFDAQLIADEIGLGLERFGSARFKAICYKTLQKIKQAGAMGAEIRASGKLPSERAKSWRFGFGYLKKTGETSKIVDKAQSVGQTIPGVIGIKVSILSPDKKIHDQITINDSLLNQIKQNNNRDEKKEEKIRLKKKK
jgi:small subunit ribosomal protein S3